MSPITGHPIIQVPMSSHRGRHTHSNTGNYTNMEINTLLEKDTRPCPDIDTTIDTQSVVSHKKTKKIIMC